MANSQSPNETSQQKPLTIGEVVSIATELQALVGSQLQDCLQTTSELGLSFYHEGESVWLWTDLNPRAPLMVRVYGKPPPRKKIARPLTLFIKSRITGRRLASVHADLARGRVLVFRFHRSVEEVNAGVCEIEVHLFPSGQNVVARDDAKSVAENKPKPIGAGEVFTVEPGRSWPEIEDAWRSRAQTVKVQAAPRDAQVIDKEWRRLVEKKEKALLKMRADLESKRDSVHREAGEWLKGLGSMPLAGDVPPEFAEVLAFDESFSTNVEKLFTRAKENVRKQEGSRDRIAMVERELQDLRAKGPSGFLKKREAASVRERGNLLARADARGRKHQLGDDLEIYIGKSAGDNLALLRRAQPFDYWLHLRDQPGAHAIMRRTRNRNVTDAEFLEAGRWVVEQTLDKRVAELAGERHDMLIVECRYVRPIKGDKLGRVHYTNDRVMALRF